jgi:integrase
MNADHSTPPVPADNPDNPVDNHAKPKKPYPDFPLTPHPSGRWCKKIRGKLYYFGPVTDPDAALARYLEQKDDLHAGRTPRPDLATLTVKDIANRFLEAKQNAVAAGELALRTWKDYRAIMARMIDGLGSRRCVTTLDPQDFADLKKKLSHRNGPARMSTIVQVIRGAFKHAYDSRLLPEAVHFGPGFRRPSKKTMRIHRASQGPKLFMAEEIRRLMGAAGTKLRAMILLGINCGFGNADCATLPLSAVDLGRGIIDYPRPKTGIPRRCILWPETIQAIRDVLALGRNPLAKDRSPTNTASDEIIFVTKYGQSWNKASNAGPLTQMFAKLLKRLGIKGRKRLGFYTLRHAFRTVADASKDSVACDYVMGHETPHMSSAYRETIDDERLRAVAEKVRRWLYVGPWQEEG